MYTQFTTFMVVMHGHVNRVVPERCVSTASVYSGRPDPNGRSTGSR